LAPPFPRSRYLDSTIVYIIGIPTVLHGLYDTLLHKDLPLGALLVAALSFGWLVWLIESSRASAPRKRKRRSA
jgi:hypothetical protein